MRGFVRFRGNGTMLAYPAGKRVCRIKAAGSTKQGTAQDRDVPAAQGAAAIVGRQPGRPPISS